jgi:hypothetical protein
VHRFRNVTEDKSYNRYSSESSITRRTALKTIGAGSISAVGFSGIGRAVGSKTENQQTGAREIGIEKEVQAHLRDQEIEKAIELLDRNNVPYDSSTSEISTSNSQETADGDFSTQAEFSRGKSKLNHTSYLSNDLRNLYGCTLNWDLNFGNQGKQETGGPPDGAGITVNPDLWELELGTYYFDNRSKLDKRGGQGLIVNFDDPNGPHSTPNKWTNGSLAAFFQKTEPGSHNLYGTYVHTWAPFGVPSGVSFSLAVGPIGVTTSGRTDTWTKREDNNI